MRSVWLTVACIAAIGIVPVVSDDDASPAPSNLPSKPQPTTDAADADGLPRFDQENLMLAPADYREWIFVGSALGLGYKENKGSDGGSFSHVYINPFGYREYRKSGTFPVGTVLMLEIASRGEKSPPALSGAYSDEFIGLEAAVKTGDRFDDVWTYYDFSGGDGQPLPKASRIRSKSCIECHRDHAATDHVFTQFYPVLRAVRDKQ